MRSVSRKLPFFLLAITAVVGATGILAQEKSRTADSIWGPSYRAAQQVRVQERHPFRRGNNTLNRLKHWNEIAISTSDHRTPVAPGEPRLWRAAGQDVRLERWRYSHTIFDVSMLSKGLDSYITSSSRKPVDR